MPPRERAKRDSIIQCQFSELGQSREGWNKERRTADSGGRHFFLRRQLGRSNASEMPKSHQSSIAPLLLPFFGRGVIDFGNDPVMSARRQEEEGNMGVPSSRRRAGPCNALLSPRFHACLFPTHGSSHGVDYCDGDQSTGLELE